MTVKCDRCGKELQEYAFSHNKLCLKCTLDTEFDRLGSLLNALVDEKT